MMNEPISSIMSKNLITITPDSTIRDAFDLLRAKKIHHLPVVEGSKLVGILTTQDIFKQETNPEDYAKIKVTDLMTTKIAAMAPNDKIGSLVLVLVENLFHAVPIIDAERNAIGIVTTLDVMKYSLAKEYPNRDWG
ncbi:MAG: CBS-domain-containing membrane protein [Saprospiraceae bacterium]|jgi:CBS-domain-containing membrane protein